MSRGVRTSAVKVTARGIRVDRDFEISDPAVRTAATAALARGHFVDEWLTALVLAKVAKCRTPTSPYGTESDTVGANAP